MIIGRRSQRRDSIIKISIASVIIALTLTYIWFTFSKQPIPRVSTDETAIVQSSLPEEKEAAIYSLPVRLLIPKLGVDAHVDYMGLTPTGDMESPSSAQSVGWYKYSSRPGNVGSAVIAGHLGLKERSVFMDLDELQIGDELRVVDDQNRSVSFVINQIRIYGKDEKPDEVFKTSDTSHLNLITCSGDWIASEKTYAERLVVFADKAPE